MIKHLWLMVTLLSTLTGCTLFGSPSTPRITGTGNYVTDTLAGMTLEQKVAQMFMWQATGTSMTPTFQKFLKEVQPGGVIIMGDNVSAKLKDFTAAIQKDAAVPLFIAIDQEGGIVKRLKADPNPGPAAFKSKTPEDVCVAYRKTAGLLKAQGINVNFGAMADIAFTTDSIMQQRSFGSTPEKVAERVSQAVACHDGVAMVVKHFPGHGRTSADSHVTIPVINTDVATWEKTDWVPFKSAIESGASMVMVGHLLYPKVDAANPASLSAKDIALLRDHGYQGVIITDSMTMLKDAYDPLLAADQAIIAGNDIVLYVTPTADPQTVINHVVEQVKLGKIQLSRIDESVRRILDLKEKILR